MTRYEFHGPESMLGIANDETKVPRAAEKSLYVEDEDGEIATWDGDQMTEMDDHKVVYDPNTGQVFDVVSADYTPIQAPEFIGPLAAELKERDLSVSGSFSMFDGGRGYLETIIGDHAFWPVDRTGQQDPVRAGTNVSWSHDGGVSVKARAFAQDGMCKNTMRRVSDAIYVKHSGDVSSRINWRDSWAGILDQLGAFSEALETVIGGAIEYEVVDFADVNGGVFGDFADVAERFDVGRWVDATEGQRKLDDLDTPPHLADEDKYRLNGFFDLLGFPGYLSYHATSRAMWRLTQKDEFDTLSAWDAYSAVTWALSHQAQFDAGSGTDEDYHRIASDLLANTPKAEEDAQRELASRLSTDDTDETAIEADLGDAVRRFKEREERLEQSFGDD